MEMFLKWQVTQWQDYMVDIDLYHGLEMCVFLCYFTRYCGQWGYPGDCTIKWFQKEENNMYLI